MASYDAGAAFVLLCLGGALIGGCTDSDEPSAVERRVENGVEVVVSHAPQWQPGEAWQVSETPLFRVGEDEGKSGDYLFTGIPGATRSPDGQVVVADRTSAELRFFDTGGALRQIVGGRGSGPGEFAWIFDLLRCDDELFHVAGPDGVISIFDFNGKFHRRLVPTERVGFPVRPSFSCGRSGALVATSRSPEPVGAEGLYRTAANLFVLDTKSDAGAVDLGSFPMLERLAGSGGSSAHPLGKRTSVAVSGDRIYVGTADTWEIAAYDRDGKLVQRTVRSAQPEPLDRVAVRRYLESWIETVAAPDRELMLHRFSDAQHPDAFPAYARLLVDTSGYLWVLAFPKDWEAPAKWSVFAEDGLWLGDVGMPANFEPIEIGEEYILGRFTGELGQESVRLYTLQR
ncbi:MAG TPA: hypothetical protein VMN60_06945 [Longimicrobiales bacterium]|nr:hypothetical protein [Longimicrobiales bacterium]